MSHLLSHFRARLRQAHAHQRNCWVPKAYASLHIDLQAFDFLEGRPSFALLEGLLQGKPQRLCALADAHHTASNPLSLQLRQLQQRAHALWEESGSQVLQLGFLFLHGHGPQGQPLRGPLLLLPLQLQCSDGHWTVSLRDDPRWNEELLLQLQPLPSLQPQLDALLDTLPRPLLPLLTELYHLLKDTAIHFNPDTLSSRLQHFFPHTRKEMRQQYAQGSYRLFPEALLGIFPPHATALLQDFEQLAGQYQTVEELLPSLQPAAETPPPLFPLDGSQEQVLDMLWQGQSICVQGPPGSGKSQLIANLAGQYIAAGKRVLIVCQKRVALQVVHDRLSQVGLQDFCQLLHDPEQDRPRIFSLLDAQIGNLEQWQQEHRRLEYLQLERDHRSALFTQRQAGAQLEAFRQALFDTSRCGRCPKELYLLAHPLPHPFPLEVDSHRWHYDRWPQWAEQLQAYAQLRGRLGDMHPWADFPGLASRSPQQLQALAQAPRQLAQSWTQLQQQLSAHYYIYITPELLDGLLDALPSVRQAIRKLESLQQTEEAIAALEAAGILPELDDTACAQLEQLLGLLEEEERHWTHRLRPSWMPSHTRQSLWQLLDLSQGSPLSPSLLRNRLRTRSQWAQAHEQLRQQYRKKQLPAPAQAPAWRKSLQQKVRKTLPEALRTCTPQQLADFCELLQRWKRERAASPLLPQQQEALLQDPALATAFSEKLLQDAEVLQALERLELHAGARALFEDLGRHAGHWDPAALCELLEQSLHAAWIAQLETEQPLLQATDNGLLPLWEQQLQQSTQTLLALQPPMAALQARERTYQDMAYNRLQRRTTYRDLHQQVRKKRQRWPLRKLVGLFADELLRLSPCWLCSPEALASVFPLQPLFDLLIVDEASQCFAERALPLLPRAQQLAIFGDEQQLPPYDLYAPKWAQHDLEEETDTPDHSAELHSLLDLGARFLPQRQLLGHYRSQTLDLVDFYNRHFYQGRLQLLPQAQAYLQHHRGIAFSHLPQGRWLQQHNLPEAQAVVDHLEALLQQGERSIGLIAFNHPQQQCLLQCIQERGIALPPEVFVKNIENVQGDERDHILLSVTYAPDAHGKLPPHFGSLSQEGGDKRLNVAISRARRQLHVCSSLLPQQLAAHRFAHAGVPLLQAFLHYAQQVAQGHYRPSLPQARHLSFGHTLRQALLQQHPSWQADLPFADLQPDSKAPLLLLTDDHAYALSPSARDAHAYIPLQLQQKGWQVERRWSRSYWMSFERKH